MECPQCKGSISRFKAIDLAKEKREGHFICPLCNCSFKGKSLPKVAIKKCLFLLFVGLLAALPADLIWKNNITLGAGYFAFVIISQSVLFLFWVIPKSQRKQPYEVVIK